MTAPRLHVLTAASGPAAVILRRGPTRQVASIGWDRATGALTPGQWLRGRIYEHRSDLSPDGRHMVYFAGTGQRWWTAVSRAPWLRAIAWIPRDHTWHGGGAFTGPAEVWLNGGGTLPDTGGELRQCPDPAAYPHGTDGFHMGGLYAAMLERRGWRQVSGEGHDAVLQRDLPGGGRLELGFELGRPDRSLISPRYGLHRADGSQDLFPDWEWAEPWGDRLHFAARGALWSAPPDSPGAARMIADLEGMSFEAVRAPYDTGAGAPG